MLIYRKGVYKEVSEHKYLTKYKGLGFEVYKEPEKVVNVVEEMKEERLKAFICPKCGKEYKTEKGLSEHMKTHKDGE